jgi:hypothetical protein
MGELSKAKDFLQQWADTTPDKATDEDVVTMIAHLSELVDIEFKECGPEQEAKLEKAKRNKKEEGKKGWEYNKEFEAELKAEIQGLRKRRLGLWTLMAYGLKAAIAKKNEKSHAVDALALSLGELARGQPEVTAFKVGAKSNLPTEGDLWLKAKVIAAIKKYPENKKSIVAKAAKVMNISEKKVEKIAYNFDSGPPPSSELAHLVIVAMNWDEKDKTVVDLLGDLTS